MTVSDILKESAYIDMSLSNLDIYNESIKDMAVGAIGAVVRMIENFINWIRNTIIPFLKKIAKSIADLIRKTKIGRKILGDGEPAKSKTTYTPDTTKVSVDPAKDAEEAKKKAQAAVAKRIVMSCPRWLNYIAHSLINPNAVMNKLATKRVDKTSEIKNLEETIDKHIKDGEGTKEVTGDAAITEAKQQLEIMEKAIMTFESNSNAIITRCEDLKRQLNGAKDQESAIMAKNTSAVIQMITKKTAQSMNLASEWVLRLKMVVEPK